MTAGKETNEIAGKADSGNDHNNRDAAFSREQPGYPGLADLPERLARTFKKSLSPARAVVFGGRSALLVAALRKYDIEAFGLDIPEGEISNDHQELRPHVFKGPLSAELPGELNGKYDLCTCIGVLEHLSETEAESAITIMSQYSEAIFFASFSSSPEIESPGDKQPPEYWVSLFENHGYALDVSFGFSQVISPSFLFRKRKYLDFSFPRPVRLLILTANPADACGEIRLFNPIEYLRTEGRVATRIFPADKKNVPSFEHIDWADLMVIQRLRNKSLRPLVTYAKKKGVPIICEMDDNLLDLPEKHIEYKSKRRRRRNISKLEWYIERADAITTSTRPLAQFLRKYQDDVFILRNYIEPFLHRFPPIEKAQTDKTRLTIGYAGTPTHGYDFQPLLTPLKRISVQYQDKIKFHFLGYMPQELAGLSNVTCETRLLSYRYYLNTLYQEGFDLALAPIEDNFFNECKSNIKFLEYSFAETPGLYSKVGPYRSTINPEETGFLVENNAPEEWFDMISYLIKHQEVLTEKKANAKNFTDKFFMLKDHYRE